MSFMTSYRDIQDMIQKGHIKQRGKGRGTYYILSRELEPKDDIILE